jgi:hypothetical protein
MRDQWLTKPLSTKTVSFRDTRLPESPPKIVLLPALRLAQSTNAAPQTGQSLNFLSLHLAPLMLIFHYTFDRIKTGSGRPDRKVDAVVRS